MQVSAIFEVLSVGASTPHPSPLPPSFLPILIPRLPHTLDGRPRLPDGVSLLSLDDAARQFSVPAGTLESAYLGFLSDLATPDAPAADVGPAAENGEASAGVEWGQARRLLRETKFGHLPDEFFNLFLEECRRRRLSPWGRHVWADVAFDERRKRRELVMGLTIDGFRAHAERTGRYAGQAPLRWADAAGNWTNCWLRDEHPAAAEARVYRRGFDEPIVRTARWKAYAPYFTTADGHELLPDHWQRADAEQLGRVAEAIALRAAFPEQFDKLYCPEEWEQARRRDKGTKAQRHEGEGTAHEVSGGEGMSGEGRREISSLGSDGGTVAIDDSTPTSEMMFQVTLVRDFDLSGRQVPGVVAFYERKHPGLHGAEPRRFWATVLADLRARQKRGDQIPPSDTA